MDDAIVGRHALVRVTLAGLVVGALLGSSYLVGSGRALAERDTRVASRPLIDATHLPPLLTAPGEEVVLRYDPHCASADEGAEDPASDPGACSPAGMVFLRAGMAGPFQPVPLAIDPSADEGRWVARVPAAIAASRRGFSYYASFRAGSVDVTLPSGGASSPHRSLPMGRALQVSLGPHVFGRFRTADQRVAQARWGSGIAEVGLEGGINVAPTGGSSFDVSEDGSVSVLDQVNRRILRWTPGSSAPSAIPVPVDGTIADLSIGPDGTMYVLESAAAERGPVVRAFDPSGHPLGVDRLTERTAAQVRVGPSGPVVLQHPSGHWRPVARANGSTLASSHVVGAPGRSFPGGSEVIVLRTGDELRLALTDGDVVRRAWRITSATPLAEVQLAEPLGRGLLVVTRVYTETEDEFVALVLGPRGLVRSVSLDSADWAETAPLSRFRRSGSSLYHLGSNEEGLFVDRFDLEVK